MVVKATRLSKLATDLKLRRHQAIAEKFLYQMSARQVRRFPVATINA